MSVNTKMTAIADPLRVLGGTTEKLGLDAMATVVTEANAEVETQTDLIAQISAALDGKAGGGSGGNTDVEDALIMRTITEYRNDRITTVGDRAFASCAALKKIECPNATRLGQSAFMYCSNLEVGIFQNVTSISFQVFMSCSALKILDFSAKVGSISTASFSGCTSLVTLIFRSTEGVSLVSPQNSYFTETPIAKGTGYVYVPAALVDSYKANSEWTTYANQIRALEDYTVDGTTTGALDESKI